MMPATSWDTLATVCFDRKVLMIGIDGGRDVLNVAQTSLIVAAYAGVATADLGKHLSIIDKVDGMLLDSGLTRRVLLHDVVALLGITQYHPGAFDVAVFNPRAAGSEDVGADLEMIANYARDLVVIDEPGLSLWDEVTAVTAARHLVASSDGQLIVARPASAEPIVRRD